MKKTILCALTLGLLGSTVCMPAAAFPLSTGKTTTEKQNTPSTPVKTTSWRALTPAKAASSAPTAVQKAVAKLNTIQGSVNTKADYYIYLQSASWCGPCQAEMPEIAKEYRSMKAGGKVELILVSWDQTPAKAKAFANQHGASFPIVMNTDPSVRQLPGFNKAKGIPTATIVDKNGEEIISAHGALIMDWKTFCQDY